MSSTVKKGKFLFGCDPEFFATYVSQDGRLCAMPPVAFRTNLGMCAEENGRHPIFLQQGQAIVHEDGAAFEVSVPPQNDWRTLWNSVNQITAAFAELLSPFSSFCSPELKALPTVGWDVDRWLHEGDEFAMATTFGCDPDMDAYNTEKKCQVIDARKHPYRYGGGHIHVSGLREIVDHPLIAVRSMVMTAGVASIAFSDVPDLEHERLFLYGKPGKFRVQKYGHAYQRKPHTAVGIEYRTPSNRWTQSIDLATRIFTMVEAGLTAMLVYDKFDSISKELEQDCVEAIRNTDQVLATQVVSRLESVL